MAEFAIRGLVRRLDKYEIEQREIKAANTAFNDWERSRRMRQLRTWIKKDRAKLQALLGVRIQIGPAKIQITRLEMSRVAGLHNACSQDREDHAHEEMD